MFHLNERLLEKLVSGSAPVSDVERIRHHVRDCRACARRLEEWRDAYAEVDYAYPELAHADSATTVTPGGMVVVPGSEGRRWIPQLSFANALWIVALLMALVVGYGANRLRSANDGFESVASARTRPPRPETGNGAGVPMPLAAPSSDSLVRVNQRTAAPAPPVTSPVPAPAAAVNDGPPAGEPETPAHRPAASRTVPRSTPAMTVDTRADPPPPIPVSPSFRNIAATEATRRLGGALRLVRGLDADHIEVGPAAAVPGAQAGLAVVRVVYRTPDGGRMLLDQQLIPADSSGFRPIDDPTLENGETAFGTAPNGVSVATWVDEDGYRISLVAQAPIDSLRRLVPLVR
jgi:hypothetical protein